MFIRWDMRLTDRELIRKIAVLEQPTNYQQLADMLGCNRSTVIRSLNRLKHVVHKQRAGRRFPYSFSINYAALPDDLRSELCPK